MIILSYLIALIVVLGVLALLTGACSALIARRHPAKSRFVASDGLRMHVDELGPQQDNGVTVVLVHGASGNMEDMRIALGDVIPARYRTILIDRPGRGWSERGQDMASPQRQADAVAQALAALGVKRVIMVGHSLGGAIAAAFAIRHPAMTAGLVLLAPTSHPWAGGISWYYTLATTPVIGPLFVHTIVTPLGALLTGNAVKGVFHPQTPPARYVSRSATLLVLRPSDFIANAQDVANLKANLNHLVPCYASIAAPTVIITGDRDVTVSNDIHAAALARTIPGARLEILPSVGHMPHHARPDRVLAAVHEVSERAQLQEM
jgi:pimeloyl-ACP methyl ester carboxylesterase